MSTATITAIFDTTAMLWVLATLIQTVDVITGRQLRRAGRAVGTRDRDRLFIWTVISCSIILVLAMFGVTIASRLILDEGRPWYGSFLLMAIALLAASTAVVAVRVLRRPESGYPVLLESLRSVEGTKLTKGRVNDFRKWLARVDSREGDVSRRVLVGRWVRAIPPVLAVVVVVSVFALVMNGELGLWAALVSLVTPLISTVLSVMGSTLSLSRNLAIHAVHLKQRGQIITLLDEFERRAPRRATGLSDRVSRALAILREQQGQATRPGSAPER